MRYFSLLAFVLVATTQIAIAEKRPVTDNERYALQRELILVGCTGGEFDEGRYEVDDAKCRGETFDIEFDADYKRVKKERD